MTGHSADLSRTEFVDRTTERATVVQTVAAIVTHRELLKNLVFRDLKLKYRGSVLGFVWSLINPLTLVAVYVFAFKTLGVAGPDYPYFIVLGVLPWTFFASAATMSTGAILDSAGLVKAVRFPRAILPVATVFFNLVQFLLTIVVFLPVMFFMTDREPAWPMLLFPVVLMLQIAFTIGVALVLATATAHFRDVRHLVDVALTLMFWTTPIVYAATQVPNEMLRRVILLTPMSPFIVAYHRIFFEREWPDVFTWTSAVAYTLIALAVGAFVFLRLDEELAEQL